MCVCDLRRGAFARAGLHASGQGRSTHTGCHPSGALNDRKVLVKLLAKEEAGAAMSTTLAMPASVPKSFAKPAQSTPASAMSWKI